MGLFVHAARTLRVWGKIMQAFGKPFTVVSSFCVFWLGRISVGYWGVELGIEVLISRVFTEDDLEFLYSRRHCCLSRNSPRNIYRMQNQ